MPECVQAHEAHLTIAGVRFRIQCERPLVGNVPSSAYDAFIGDGPRQDLEFPVTVIPHPFKGLDQCQRVFEAESMWAWFIDGPTRYLAHTGGDLHAPLWVAQLPSNFSDVRVYCGGMFLSENEDGVSVSNPVRYPLDQLLLVTMLASRQGCLIHAAGVEQAGRLWLLAGRSGAGKSTAARLLMGRAGITLLSDDRLVVRREGGEVRAYGTPWPGDARVAVNRSATLAGILFLDQSQENVIVPLQPGDALARLLPVVSVPWYEPDLHPLVLDFCGGLVESVSCHCLRFRPDTAAADMLASFINGQLA
jgi:hypothetical protein